MSAVPAPAVTRDAAQTEIAAAWQSHRMNGLDFGRVCFEWSERLGKSKGGYGSKGEGLSEILNVLDIPRHVVDYWILKWKASLGQGVPCPSCSETFPSKKQLKRHQRKVHAEKTETNENADVVQGEQVASRDQMAYQTVPSAPTSVSVAVAQDVPKGLEETNPEVAHRMRAGSLVLRPPAKVAAKTAVKDEDYFARAGRQLATVFSNVDARLNEMAAIEKSEWSPVVEEGIRSLRLNLKEVWEKAKDYDARLEAVLRNLAPREAQ